MKMEVRTRDEGGRSLPVLAWDLPEPRLAISSAPLGGGIGVQGWVLNAQVAPGYDRGDPDAHLAGIAAALGMRGAGIGLLTAADVRSVRTGTDGGVEVAATVGVRDPLWAAAPGQAQPRPPHDRPTSTPGTINVVAFVPVRLSEGALVNAVATVTEAKAQALWDAGIEATGTATDAVCVLCAASGPAQPYGGPRSEWGSRLARAAHAAVRAGTPGRCR